MIKAIDQAKAMIARLNDDGTYPIAPFFAFRSPSGSVQYVPISEVTQEIADLIEEVAYWRREAVARAWSGSIGLIDAHLETPDAVIASLDKTRGALAALDDADAKKWHLTPCTGCDKGIFHGQQVVIWAEGERSHVDCDDVDAKVPDDHPDLRYEGQQLPTEIYDDGFQPDQMAKLVADARSRLREYENA